MASIWIDGDACPVVIKEILFRAAERRSILLTLVANRPIRVPISKYIKLMQVSPGFDIADQTIVELAEANDLVITADIPLASEVIAKGAHALNPNGEMYTTETIRSRLNIRDFMDTMRASGVNTGGPPPLTQAARQKFANHLDRWLAKLEKG